MSDSDEIVQRALELAESTINQAWVDHHLIGTDITLLYMREMDVHAQREVGEAKLLICRCLRYQKEHNMIVRKWCVICKKMVDVRLMLEIMYPFSDTKETEHACGKHPGVKKEHARLLLLRKQEQEQETACEKATA